jgi:hypothetical protein
MHTEDKPFEISDVRLGFCMYLNQIYFQKGSFFS